MSIAICYGVSTLQLKIQPIQNQKSKYELVKGIFLTVALNIVALISRQLHDTNSLRDRHLGDKETPLNYLSP